MGSSDVLERGAARAGVSAISRSDPRRLLADARMRIFLVVAFAAMAAQLSADFTPRGPVTAGEALATMAAAATVGLIAGALMARRWAMLLAPAVFVVVLEVARLGVEGPAVDAPPLTLAGLTVWVGARLLHGLFALAPMMVGIRWGVELATRRGARARRLGRGGVVGLAALTAGLGVLAVVVALPASTARILDADGEPLPGSIAELTTVTIDGAEQALMIRGASTDNPVLLHLAGGPGGTDIGAMRLDSGLEQHFVVVTWDQRGTGKSYRALDPADTLTLESAVADTIAVTEHLGARFGQERIFITGQSWGTLPAVLAVQRRPERFHAYVGTGQMVAPAATDEIFYTETLAWARARDDTGLEARLLQLGPPPYDRYTDYLTIVGAERDIYAYPEFDGHTEMPATVWVPENSFMDRMGALRGLVDTYALLYPQLQSLDLRTTVPRLEVPVYVVMGEHEARGRVDPAREWFEALDAPAKTWVELPSSSHRASFERPADYTRLLTEIKATAASPGNLRPSIP